MEPLETINAAIAAKAYPPTHEYRVERKAGGGFAFVPTGVLAERVEIIDRVFPAFFATDRDARFLDVGCNKGFFAFHGSQHFGEAVGIDHDDECYRLCQKISQVVSQSAGFPNWWFAPWSFDASAKSDVRHGRKWNRVWIGNGPHYLYRDAGGWEWCGQLAAIVDSGGLVLMEGPISMQCGDMAGFLTPELESTFAWVPFSNAMYRGFKFVASVPSPSYTPDRILHLWERR